MLRNQKAEIVALLLAEKFASDPIERRNPGCPIPLTAVQDLWWEANHAVAAEPNMSIRPCYDALCIEGPLNADLLQIAVDAVVDRHESLRTRIVFHDARPFQEVDPPKNHEVEVVDLSRVHAGGRDVEVVRLATELVYQEIDLSIGPLFDAKLFKVSNDRHVLVLVLDHFIADGLSVGILEREIWDRYRQLAQGLSCDSTPPTIQFSDYAVWQKNFYPVWMKRHSEYWRRLLTGSRRTCIPAPKSLQSIEVPGGDVMEVPFGAHLSGLLRAVARKERTSTALVVLTIYIAVMARWCDQTDLLVSFVTDGRYRAELVNMIGDLAYHLHLRIITSSDDTFMSLLRKIIFEYRAAYEHQDFGWVPAVIPECRGLFTSTDLYFNWIADRPKLGQRPTRAGNLDDVCVEPFPFQIKWPIGFRLYFVDSTDGIRATIQFRPDYIQHEILERLAKLLQSFAAGFVTDPMKHLSLVE